MKNSREKINNLLKGIETEGGMWTGHPSKETIEIFAEEWNLEPTAEAIYQYLNDDCRWIPADAGYKKRSSAIDPYLKEARKTLGGSGFFAEAENLSDIEKYPWPDAKDCDFTEIYKKIDQHQDKMVFTGLWSPFFHQVCDFFGMENYFIQLFENPALVEGVTERVVDYYVQANEVFFEGLGDRADIMFFGNDLGTQLDLFLSPEQFRQFILPSVKRLVAVGKKYNKKIMLHSCGSIYRIIPDLIEAGVDILHPIQAKAKGMSAKELAQYKKDLCFMGGIDAQELFVWGTPDDIKREVWRIRDVLGPRIIISPSHEEILPNVPAQNILAMAQASREKKAYCNVEKKILN